MSTYMKLRNFVVSGEESNLDLTVQRIAEALRETNERAQLQICVVSDEESYFYRGLQVDKNICEVSSEQIDNSDFEVITSEETWLQISSGTYSPVQAFLDGKMRIRGDVKLGERILQQLGTGTGNTHC